MSKEAPIYLDYHASTPVDPRVLDQMLPWFMQDFGNPSSNHYYGQIANKAVRQAAKQVSNLVGAHDMNGVMQSVIFTSGATESINLALKGFSSRHQPSERPFRIALMALEHKAVLDSCKQLEASGQAELRWLKIDTQGRLDLNDLVQACKEGIDLIVVMAANNEIGTCYPLDAIGRIADDYGCAFFCDASQAAGKIPLQFSGYGMTMMAVTAHKFYGPKGSGALIVKKGIQLHSQIHGGGHQQGLRSGTLNVPGIVGLGAASELRQQEMLADEERIASLRDRFQANLQAEIPELVVNGALEARLAGNLHVAIPGIANDVLLFQLKNTLAFSTSSACSSMDISSHVLTAIGQPAELQRCALRISLGKQTTEVEIEQATEYLIKAYRAVREKSSVS